MVSLKLFVICSVLTISSVLSKPTTYITNDPYYVKHHHGSIQTYPTYSYGYTHGTNNGYVSARYEDDNLQNGYNYNLIGAYEPDSYHHSYENLGYGYPTYDPSELRQRRLGTESEDLEAPTGFKTLHSHHPSERVAHNPGHDSFGGLHGVVFGKYEN